MQDKSITIRSARHEDLPNLLDLYQHLNPSDDQTPLSQAISIFDQIMAFVGSEILIGEIGDTLIASCTLIVIPNLTRGGKPYGLIENVVIHRDHRARGFGKKLLSAASKAAWQANCYKVMLMTGSKKPETINFYLSAGFEQTKTGFQKRNIPARLDM